MKDIYVVVFETKTVSTTELVSKIRPLLQGGIYNSPLWYRGHFYTLRKRIPRLLRILNNIDVTIIRIQKKQS